MMDFTPQNKGKWIAPLPSTNRINNRGKGKEQYKRLCIRNGMKQNTKWNATKHEKAGKKTGNDTTKKAHQLY
ncbi:MAG: hypothetical protein HXN98_03580 [Prevotella salivae]|nr:hypothetical protein [Segatella salivae]